MTLDKPALRIAGGFFLLWLGILYLGADHPPPPRFVWVVLLDLPAALLVFWRVPTYRYWQVVGRPRGMLRVLRDGAVTGLAFGTFALLVAFASPGGRPAPGWGAVIVWLVVLTLMGAMNTALLFAFISLTRGRGVKHAGGTGAGL